MEEIIEGIIIIIIKVRIIIETTEITERKIITIAEITI